MSLFDRFRKKPATTEDNTVPTPEATAPDALSPDRNFVDDLVSYFSSNPDITAAYFGFGYNNTTRQHILVLAIDHQTDEDTVRDLTWMIKCLFMSDTDIHYTSNITNQELLDYIKQHNPAFYHQDGSAVLQQKIMKQWFDQQQYHTELIDTLKTTPVFTLAHKMENSKDLMLATYVRESGEFIPLFASEDMIAKSGMINLPDDRVVVKMTFQRILNGINPGQLFILNPATPFEVEMKV
ncbi:SseB family protein [Chitinophaga agri]|uniref:SseB family protein n=1 Tax=Chitinophaga agri TaxID=2703787 RepID=A0A6B9Z7V0_9BACT|nr:SseB family protein [Chitinophaga agri]QHS58300.1 SseB family protein [Chitinophaga agri]